MIVGHTKMITTLVRDGRVVWQSEQLIPISDCDPQDHTLVVEFDPNPPDDTLFFGALVD